MLIINLDLVHEEQDSNVMTQSECDAGDETFFHNEIPQMCQIGAIRMCPAGFECKSKVGFGNGTCCKKKNKSNLISLFI